MTLFQALFLATVQGITEFLPISSSGHLVFFQHFFMLSTPPVLFDVLLHFGTLGSILVFFRKEIRLLFDFGRHRNTWLLVVLGSIPAGVVGYLLNSKIDRIFSSLSFVGIAWIFFGSFLLLSSKIKAGKGEGKTTWKDALYIGAFQAAALFPGVSRSGATISAGLIRKLPRESAFRFSFLLAIPAIIGATVLKVKEVSWQEFGLFRDLSFMLLAGVIGYFSLGLLQKVLQSKKFYLFGLYCLLIGFLALFFHFAIS